MNTIPVTTAPTTASTSADAIQASAIAACDNAPYTCVQRVQGVRVRQEREDGYLLYQPTTDELHLVDARGMAVFELCDGRSIDEVVAEGARLLSGETGTDDARRGAERDVFAFLHKLQARSLVAWR